MSSRVLDRIQQGALWACGAGLLGTLVFGLQDPVQFLRSYLYAYLFWLGLPIGCLSILMIHHLTGGMWGLIARRILEAGTRTLPLLAILFLPLGLGVASLYPWAGPRPKDKAYADLLDHQALYLNVPFFWARALFYFGTWIILAQVLASLSLELDKGEDRRVSRRLRSVSGGGLVLLGLTITFSSFDWAMSLNPRWSSTIYGLIFMLGQVLTAMCFVLLMLSVLGKEAPFDRVAQPTAVHDLGKLLLAFVMLWTYLHLSQFLIIWSGNVPDEVVYYVRRLEGGWAAIGIALVLFHFALPFVLLLSRGLKRNLRLMGYLAAGFAVMRVLEVYWLVEPSFGTGGLNVHVLDVLLPLGLGGIWVAYFVQLFRGRPPVPVGEPEIRVLLEGA